MVHKNSNNYAKKPKIIFKDIFRNLLIYLVDKEFIIVYRVDTHSGNSVLDMSNLRLAITQIQCSLKICNIEHGINRCKFYIIVEGNVLLSTNDVKRIADDCVFFYSKEYIELGVYELQIIFEAETQCNIIYRISRGCLETIVIGENVFKYYIDGEKIYENEFNNTSRIQKKHYKLEKHINKHNESFSGSSEKNNHIIKDFYAANENNKTNIHIKNSNDDENLKYYSHINDIEPLDLIYQRKNVDEHENILFLTKSQNNLDKKIYTDQIEINLNNHTIRASSKKKDNTEPSIVDADINLHFKKILSLLGNSEFVYSLLENLIDEIFERFITQENTKYVIKDKKKLEHIDINQNKTLCFDEIIRNITKDHIQIFLLDNSKIESRLNTNQEIFKKVGDFSEYQKFSLINIKNTYTGEYLIDLCRDKQKNQSNLSKGGIYQNFLSIVEKINNTFKNELYYIEKNNFIMQYIQSIHDIIQCDNSLEKEIARKNNSILPNDFMFLLRIFALTKNSYIRIDEFFLFSYDDKKYNIGFLVQNKKDIKVTHFESNNEKISKFSYNEEKGKNKDIFLVFDEYNRLVSIFQEKLKCLENENLNKSENSAIHSINTFFKEHNDYNKLKKIFDQNILNDILNIRCKSSFHVINNEPIIHDIAIKGFLISIDDQNFIIIQNDISFKNGSFSINEDIFYSLALERSIFLKIPFVFVSCNSGARIGLSESNKKQIKLLNLKNLIEIGNDKNGKEDFSDHLQFSTIVNTNLSYENSNANVVQYDKKEFLSYNYITNSNNNDFFEVKDLKVEKNYNKMNKVFENTKNIEHKDKKVMKHRHVKQENIKVLKNGQKVFSKDRIQEKTASSIHNNNGYQNNKSNIKKSTIFDPTVTKMLEKDFKTFKIQINDKNNLLDSDLICSNVPKKTEKSSHLYNFDLKNFAHFYQKNYLLAVINDPMNICKSQDNRIISIYENKTTGAENLAYSGLLAAKMCKAYKNTLTISYITGRSVGIGAYLNKLGERMIIKEQSPLLLTGFQALNKLLQKKVYSNNNQVGGPDIMKANGNCHLNVQNDFSGVKEIFKWIDYFFSSHKANKEKFKIVKNWFIQQFYAFERYNKNFLQPLCYTKLLMYIISKKKDLEANTFPLALFNQLYYTEKYNIEAFYLQFEKKYYEKNKLKCNVNKCSVIKDNSVGKIKKLVKKNKNKPLDSQKKLYLRPSYSDIFISNSFKIKFYDDCQQKDREKYFICKYMDQRYNENYTEREIIDYIFDKGSLTEYKQNYAKNIILARGKINNNSFGLIATESNFECIYKDCAKNVIFSDSADKIAQGIKDFSNERLNIIILACFRGFSGRKEDMEANILKFGSNIVKAINSCKTNILFYIPPKGEIRGGSWVVFDPHISNKIVIVAHPCSEVGILEAQGIAELKFKKNEVENIFSLSNIDYDPLTGSEIVENYCKSHDHIFRMFNSGNIQDLLFVDEFKKYISLYFDGKN